MCSKKARFRENTTIEDLPPEILHLIFDTLCEESRSDIWDHWCGDDQDDDEARFRSAEVFAEELHCLSLFPYAIASVCTTWKNILARFPEFWTHLAIFFDSELERDSLASFASHLQFSRELKLHISVSRRNPEACSDGFREEEALRVKKILDIIQPHIHRCISLIFDVTFTSSLPRIATDFPNIAPHLGYLSLRASIGDGLRKTCDKAELVTKYQFPALKELDMDGWNFVDLFKNAKSWLDDLPAEKHYSSLTGSISHYRPATDDPSDPSRFFLYDAFPIFSKFGMLELDDLDFSCRPETEEELNTAIEPSDIVIWWALRLSRLSAEATAALLRNVYPSDLKLVIDRCSLSGVDEIPLQCFLELHGIEDSVDLCDILSEWEGHHLTVDSCPGFNDDVLYFLGSMMRREVMLNAPSLNLLHVWHCSVSVHALRKMVEGRRAAIKALPHLRPEGFIEAGTEENLQLCVVDTTSGPGDDDDRKWFKEASKGYLIV